MDISTAIQSKYLAAPDLSGKRLKLRVSHVEMEELGDGKKPVIYFQGKQKGMVLNKTKIRIMMDCYGKETDDWAGKEVVLSPTKVDYKGEIKDAIAIEPFVPMAAENEDPPF